jgi:hypothetical protein
VVAKAGDEQLNNVAKKLAVVRRRKLVRSEKATYGVDMASPGPCNSGRATVYERLRESKINVRLQRNPMRCGLASNGFHRAMLRGSPRKALD